MVLFLVTYGYRQLMKKLFTIFLLYLSSSGITQTKIGIRGGMNLSNFIYRPQYSGDSKGEGSYLPRLNAGLLIEIPLSDDNDWFINTGPYYAGKGSGTGRKLFSTKNDTIRTYLNYLELPVSIQYKFSEGSRNRFLAGAGIYASYGFKGKTIYRNDPDRTERNLHRKENPYKRIEAGFSVNSMYEVNERWGIRLDFSRSLFDISRYQWKYNNNVFGFSFFWYLKNKKSEED
jgi:Outer membrane protein beta-barrel domain